jgi:hypothetical protein
VPVLGCFVSVKPHYYYYYVVSYCPILKGQEARLDFLTLEDGTNTLTRNVGKELPIDAA